MAKAKNVAKAALNLALLSSIIAAGEAGMLAPVAEATPLATAGYVETNPAGADASGNIATRATPEGIAFMNTQSATGQTPATGAAAATATAATAKPAFAIDDGIEMPKVSGRGRTGTQYPFDQLNVGQSFFVPNDEKKPDAAKSLASTVSSATARYSVPKVPAETKANAKGEQVPVMVEVRKFVVRPVEGGARIWRTL